jgi:glucose-1-phosphatase
VFDLGGVVANFYPERRLDALASDSGIPRAVIHDRLFVSGLDHDAELGRHTAESITAAILERLEHRLSVPALIACWALAFEPNVDLLDAIGRLSTRRALFTNNGPMLDLCLAGPLAQLVPTFEVIICSWHLGATKPSPHAYTRAAHRLSTRPARLVLIDDSQVNVDAAQAAGWQAVAHTSLASTLAHPAIVGQFRDLLGR